MQLAQYTLQITTDARTLQNHESTHCIPLPVKYSTSLLKTQRCKKKRRRRHRQDIKGILAEAPGLQHGGPVGSADVAVQKGWGYKNFHNGHAPGEEGVDGSICTQAPYDVYEVSNAFLGQVCASLDATWLGGSGSISTQYATLSDVASEESTQALSSASRVQQIFSAVAGSEPSERSHWQSQQAAVANSKVCHNTFNETSHSTDYMRPDASHTQHALCQPSAFANIINTKAASATNAYRERKEAEMQGGVALVRAVQERFAAPSSVLLPETNLAGKSAMAGNGRRDVAGQALG